MFILSSAGIPKIYLFTSHEIRVILTPNDEKTTYANKTFEQVAVDISTQHLAVQSRSSTSINFDVIDLSQGLDQSSISFSYARLSATTTINKMRIDNETDQSVTIINVQEGENTQISTTLIDKISIPFTDPQFAISNINVTKYTINKAMRCLHIDRVEAETTNPLFVFVDSDNRIQMFSINFDAGSVSGQTSSQPLDYFLYSAGRSYSRLAISY